MKAGSTAIVLLVSLILVSCAPSSAGAPAVPPRSAPVSTLIQTAQTPSQEPSPTVIASSASAMKLERWQEYENALAAVFLPLPYLPGKGLCEWELLGQSEHEVYVWAVCQVADSAGGAAMSAPAVMYLAENGSIEKVRVPRDGAQYGADIREMFPKEIQDGIFSHSTDVSGMWSHLQLRHETPEPPLIVQSGAPLP